MMVTDHQERKIWVFGTVPQPVGGVAIFLQRLIESKRVPLAGLIDPYFGTQKSELPISHWRPKKKGILHRILTLVKLFRLRDELLFINGSRPESILALFPFLLFRNAKKSLLLHHGDLWGSIESSRIKSALVKYVLGGYNSIYCLSEKQRRFYISNDVEESRLTLVDSYIGIPETKLRPENIEGVEKMDAERLSKQAREAIAWVSQTRSKVIIGSGYAQPFYNHEWVLDFLQQENHADFHNARYILCCYGPETDHLQQLRERCSVVPNARLFFGLSSLEFNAVLSLSDIYVRPTSVDSFGIAIHDARALGLQVVASNACERPNDIWVHESGNYDQFRKLLKKCLASPNRVGPGAGRGAGDIAGRITIVDALQQFAQAQLPLNLQRASKELPSPIGGSRDTRL
ncbi:glycosyltransferase [Parasphingorhabdus flavimaris]|jgi:hypothetical protein|uniref:Glycosyltransferase n=1 Tax=Parasphingorhabdus flavimaris TaxID=266812 RepID=A0ABX2N5M9_9SPHN|nr:glycosyltransferase [Parasphingorhabdus flavimaris]NVD29030.1 glycosyltransferase [Parasphingorhabdus flavimaris]